MDIDDVLPPKRQRSQEPMELRTLRLPKELIAELETFSKETQYPFPEVVRRFLTFAVDTFRERQKANKKK